MNFPVPKLQIFPELSAKQQGQGYHSNSLLSGTIFYSTLFSVSVIRHRPKAALGGKGLFQPTTLRSHSITKESQSENRRQESESRYGDRGHGGALLRTCSVLLRVVPAIVGWPIHVDH